MADVSDLNPVFASRLAQLRDALTKAGIANSIVSGYRSPEYQGRMFANHQAKQAGQPLPYPNDEAPAVVAPPWRSFHNYGLAADFNLANDADYARLASIAPQFGLTGIGASDKGHIQLGGDLASDIAQYHLANWRPESQPAPAQGAIAYAGPSGQPSRPATPTPGPLMFGGLNPDARGMRNNNPGNLIANDFTAGLPGYKGSDGKFAIFDTPEHGAAALDRNLTSYGSKGINTPLGIASTWAPAGDNNNPNSYGAQIAKALGVGPNDKIDMNDPAVRNKVSQAIALVENGPGNSSGVRTAYVGSTVPGTTLNASGAPTAVAGGPAAPAAAPAAGSALPGFQPGSPAAKMMDQSIKTLGLDGGGGQDQPPPMPQIPFQPAQAMGGRMMLGPGGQNTMGASVAQQALAQQGFLTQPSLASFGLGATRTATPAMPGTASGLPSMPGTTLNSPSQLQMALMTGAMNPYDLYSGAYAQGQGT